MSTRISRGLGHRQYFQIHRANQLDLRLATFFSMLYAFDSWNNPPLFQTGWFVESLLTRTLIIHIIRTAKIPFLQSRDSGPLIATSVIICVVGIALPFTPVGQALKFTPLPPLYWPIVAAFLLTYATLTHLVKTWFVRRWGPRPRSRVAHFLELVRETTRLETRRRLFHRRPRPYAYLLRTARRARTAARRGRFEPGGHRPAWGS
jgi:hypothetical protein